MEIRMDRYKLKQSVTLTLFSLKNMIKTCPKKQATTVVSSKTSASTEPPTSAAAATNANNPTFAYSNK